MVELRKNSPQHLMKRRQLLSSGGAALAGSVFTSRIAKAEEGVIGLELPKLPYAPEALEPHIDAQTMTIHHDKHHQAYITKLGEALKAANIQSTDTLALVKGIRGLAGDVQSAIRNNGGGHLNHSWFWKWMAPAGSVLPGPHGKLAEAIQGSFGSIDDFKKAFSDAAAKRFGSGWVWLVKKEDDKLVVTSTANQDNPLMKGIVPDSDLGTPILGLDVWEHAYYLKYQNKRADYISAWWNVVNWQEVANCF